MVLLRRIFSIITALVLSLRYRVKVRGLDAVRGLDRVLVLPNHPAYIDPPIVVTSLWATLHPRPLLLGSMFKNPLLSWMPKLLDAVAVPDLEERSKGARDAARHAIDQVVAGLSQGKNQILWPAGHVQERQGEELGSARSAFDIIQAVSDMHVVLVRTRGLWGSRFSYAYLLEKPRLGRRLLEGLGILLANLIFFTPRRKVTLDVELVDAKKLASLDRSALNRMLEDWYNAERMEEPTFVPYHFLFGRRHYDFPDLVTKPTLDETKITAKTRQAVFDILHESLGNALDNVVLDAGTRLDGLGLDSLETMEVSLAIDRQFGFSNPFVPKTVGDLWAHAEGLIESAPPKPAAPSWFQPPTNSIEKPAVLGETVPEAFVRRALACRQDTVCADDMSGVLTYEKLLVGVRLMAREFAKIDERYIGLLLPASVAADVAFLAVHLAGKIPVLLNWTTGPASLAHATQLMGFTRVVTSKKFIDRTEIHIEGSHPLYLEELKKSVSKIRALIEVLSVRFFPSRIRWNTPHPNPQEDPCAVLFTSGSEKAPKAVPLTHENILTDIASALEVFPLTRENSFLGFLPPFHSFGLTMTVLAPILSGCRVVHHPDPTDAFGLARKASTYRASMMLGTPTLLGFIAERAKPGDLDAARFVVTGAEKCPDALFETLHRLSPNAIVLEGYGITECSPLVSANVPDRRKRGTIGHPIPGVRLRVVDPDELIDLPQGAIGMLLVAGKTVFPGYIGNDVADPFHRDETGTWYITGDLVHFDDEGFLVFDGRLKRFLKAGGEMISLPAIEEPLARVYPPADGGPRVAVEGVERHPGRHIVLFTTETISLREANGVLKDAGFQGVMRVDEVRTVEKIPMLGTGKTDYKILRRLVEEHIPHANES